MTCCSLYMAVFQLHQQSNFSGQGSAGDSLGEGWKFGGLDAFQNYTQISLFLIGSILQQSFFS